MFERGLKNQSPDVEPATPRAAQAAAGALFGAISRLRGSRSLHPDGVVFEAGFESRGPLRPALGVPLFEERRSRPAIVRLSRALGLPEAVPDILGLSVRFVDAHGRGRHQDFLLVTSIDAPLGHHLLVPASGFFSLSYSSLLPYSIAGETRLVGAVPATSPRPGGGSAFAELLETAAEREVSFELALAEPSGRWRAVGDLVLGERVPEATGERIRFNPWNTGDAIRPTGPFMGLRDGAYRGSQAGWSA